MAPHPPLVQRQFSQVPPPGLPPGGGESRAPAIIAGNTICLIAGTVFFLARVYSRAIISSTWKAEDTTLVIAWVFAAVNSAMQYAQIDYGAGQHLSFIIAYKPSNLIQSQKFAYASQLLGLAALSAPKLSICLTYLRIFSRDVSGRRMIKALIVILLVPLIPIFCLSIFQCKPISAYWIEGRPATKCYEDISGLYLNGALNVFIDIALIAIVLPRVLSLPLNKQQKWALIFIVTLGSLAAVAGTVRVIRVGTTITKKNFDATWDMYDISIWTSTEIYVSLICAAAPGVKPLVSKILPKLLGTTLPSQERATRIAIYPHDSRAMKSTKYRRGTIGSARVRRNMHDSILEEAEGPYTEIEGGVQSTLLDDGKDEYEKMIPETLFTVHS